MKARQAFLPWKLSYPKEINPSYRSLQGSIRAYLESPCVTVICNIGIYCNCNIGIWNCFPLSLAPERGTARKANIWFIQAEPQENGFAFPTWSTVSGKFLIFPWDRSHIWKSQGYRSLWSPSNKITPDFKPALGKSNPEPSSQHCSIKYVYQSLDASSALPSLDG